MITLSYRGGPRNGRSERMPRWVKNQAQPPKVVSCTEEAATAGMRGVYELGATTYRGEMTEAFYYWKELGVKK